MSISQNVEMMLTGVVDDDVNLSVDGDGCVRNVQERVQGRCNIEFESTSSESF